MPNRALIGFFSLILTVTYCAPATARTLLQNKGSDTMVHAVQSWSEAYHKVDPQTGIVVNAGGSGTGIAALINGTVDIANTSRAMTTEEIARARKRSQDPVQHLVGYDAVAVYVHSSNPIRSLNFAQLAEIYGEGGSIEFWTDLGIEVSGCKDQKIVRVGRQSSSGTYVYFRRAVMGSTRDYKLGTRSMVASRHVLDLVSQTPCAIGYSSFAYSRPTANTVCLSESEDKSCVAPSASTIQQRNYPITRPLYLYTNGQPEGVIREYLEWVLGDDGQCILPNKGYGPVRALNCQQLRRSKLCAAPPTGRDKLTERWLLPWAADRGIAMITNRSFENGILFR